MKLHGACAVLLVLSCLASVQGCSGSSEQPRTGTVSALVGDYVGSLVRLRRHCVVLDAAANGCSLTQ